MKSAKSRLPTLAGSVFCLDRFCRNVAKSVLPNVDKCDSSCTPRCPCSFGQNSLQRNVIQRMVSSGGRIVTKNRTKDMESCRARAEPFELAPPLSISTNSAYQTRELTDQIYFRLCRN